MLYRATEAFFAGRRLVQYGQVVSATDPVVVGRAHLFVAVEEPGVEQATAAPGERRAVRRPLKKGKP